MSIISKLYRWMINRPEPKFKNGDLVQINDDGAEHGINTHVKTLKVTGNYWTGDGYVVDLNNSGMDGMIHEKWLEYDLNEVMRRTDEVRGCGGFENIKRGGEG